MPLRITKKDCDTACALLNKEKYRKGKEGMWIEPLVEFTNEEPTRASVAALSHFVNCNMEAFQALATVKLPGYIQQHPHLPPQVAKQMLETQLVVRLTMYVCNRVYDQQAMSELFSLDPEEGSKE